MAMRKSISDFFEGSSWPDDIDDSTRRDQLKLVYDYIKFHIGLYLGTPAALGLLGNVFSVTDRVVFQICLGTVMVIYLLAGLHASRFMGRFINAAWDNQFLTKFAAQAFSPKRRFLHHWTYWLGLVIGLAGLIVAKVW